MRQHRKNVVIGLIAPFVVYGIVGANSPAKSESAIRERIDALSTLLSSRPTGETQKKLLWSRSSERIALLKAMEANAKLSPQTSRAKELDLLLKDLDQLEPLETDRKKLSLLHYWRGSAYRELGRKDDMAKSLEVSLQFNAQGKHASAVAFNLIELFYEGGDYARLLKTGQEFVNSIDPKDQPQVRHRMAWSYIHLNRPSEGEKLFLQNIKEPSGGVFAEESLRDLGGIHARNLEESQIIENARTYFGLRNQQLSYLQSAYRQLVSDGKVRKAQRVTQGVEALEPSSERRVAVWYEMLRQSQTHHPSLTAADLIERLSTELARMLPGEREVAIKPVRQQMADQVYLVFEQFRRSQSGELENKEKIPKSVLEHTTHNVGVFFMTYFEKDKRRGNVVRARAQLCQARKDDSCLLGLSNYILQDKDLTELRADAEKTQQDVLGRHVEQGSKPHATQMVKLLEHQLATEQSLASKAGIQLDLGKAYVVLDQKDKALAYFEAAYEQAPQEELYFEIQKLRFSGGQFEKVVNSRPTHIPTGKTAPDADLVREAHLKLALANANDPKSFQTFEKNLESYLARQPDLDKRAIAINALVTKSLDRKEARRALARLYREDKKVIYSPNILSTRSQVYASLLAEGVFEQDVVNLVGRTAEKEKSINALKAKLHLGAFESITPDLFENLDSAGKGYVFGTWALIQPAKARGWLEQNADLAGPLKDLGWLAVQLSSDDTKNYTLSDWEKNFFPAAIAAAKANQLTAVEKSYQAVSLPTALTDSLKEQTHFSNQLARLRELRKKMVREMPKMHPEQQKRTLRRAIETEKRVVELLNTAPVPGSLMPKDQEEYSLGIEKLANEFSSNILELEKAEATLAQGTLRAPASAADVSKFRGELQWPTTPFTNTLKTRATSGKPLQALLQLDQLKIKQSLSPSDYAEIRAKILLSANPSVVMKKYVLDELNANNQTHLVQKWMGGQP
jgi:tetratricopeptide (TPR) repeat protein